MVANLKRQGIIDAILSDDNNRPASAVLLDDGTLCSWHGTGDENSPYDVFVFQESYRGSNLQEWQNTMLCDATYRVCLGNSNPNSLKATHAVSWTIDLQKSPELLEKLRKRFL